MFPYLLVIVLNAGTPAATPIVVAGFRDLSTCELVAAHMQFEATTAKHCRKVTTA